MATRSIEIKVMGEAGQYEATVQRIIERNNQMSRAAIQGAQQAAQQYGSIEKVLVNLSGNVLPNLGRAFASAFPLAALVAFGKQALDAAGQIDDLAKRTGFARQTLSGIKSAVEESGGSLQGFATAINKLQKSLGDIDGDGKNAAKALSAIGVNVKEMAAAAPEKAFEMFADALSKVEGQNNRVTVATRVMSRAGAEQIPIVLELAGQFRKLASEGVSNERIAQLDRYGDAITRLKTSFINLAQEGIGRAIEVWDAWLGISDQAKRRNAMVDLADQLDLVNKKIANTKNASPSTFGLFSSDATREGRREAQLLELQKQRLAIMERLTAVGAEQGTARAKDLAARTPINQTPLDLGGDDSAAKKAASERLQFLEQLKDKLRAAQAQFEGLSDPQKAALTQLSELEEKVNKFNDPAMRNLVETIKLYTLAVIEKNKEDEKQKAIVEQVAAINKNLSESEAAEVARKQKIRDEIDAEFALKEKLLDLDVERLRILGLDDAAARQQLENIIKLNAERRAALAAADIERTAGELAELDKRTANAQLKLNQLGKTSIDVVGEVTRAATDIVNAAINGTLKFADIGKSIMGTFVRFAIEQMSTFFRQLVQQQQNAQIAANAGVMLPSGSSGSGGGILQNLLGNFGTGGSGGGGGLSGLLGGLFGGGGRPAGVSGPLLPNGNFLSGGGGFGGLGAFGGLLDMGLNFGGLIGAGNIGSGGPLGVGGQITGQIASTVLTSSISAMLGGSGGILGTLLPALMPMLSNPITAIIAAIVVAIMSIFGAQKINPTVITSSKTQGFIYDAVENQFKFGTTTTRGRGIDIPGSVVDSTTAQVQKILESYSKQWTDVLNLFPVIVHDQMIPALEHANALLNAMFSRLKFSEGGSRTIAEEIADLGKRAGAQRFFVASRGIIGAGLSASFQRAGLGGLSDLASAQFGDVNLTNPTDFNSLFRIPGLKPPRQKAEDVQKFTKAVAEFIGLSGGLATISTSGVTPFLTAQDRARLESQFADVLKITEGTEFAPAVEALKERIKPITDFLEQAVQQSSDLFGRGIMAALDAATASQAMEQFKSSLGAGVKDVIFKGITESFLASAQFNDLLAPIQKIIREFTQQAINTGETPDIAAFRRAILPGIEDIAARADILAPLLAELQKLGIDVKDALKIFVGSTAAGTLGSGVINITINGDVDSEERAADFARRVEQLLRPGLPPPT